MDLLGTADYVMRFKHRHGDGTWGELEPAPVHLDPASHDQERDWPEGRLYVCPGCDEQLQVIEDRTPGGPGIP